MWSSLSGAAPDGPTGRSLPLRDPGALRRLMRVLASSFQRERTYVFREDRHLTRRELALERRHVVVLPPAGLEVLRCDRAVTRCPTLIPRWLLIHRPTLCPAHGGRPRAIARDVRSAHRERAHMSFHEVQLPRL